MIAGDWDKQFGPEPFAVQWARGWCRRRLGRPFPRAPERTVRLAEQGSDCGERAVCWQVRATGDPGELAEFTGLTLTVEADGATLTGPLT